MDAGVSELSRGCQDQFRQVRVLLFRLTHSPGSSLEQGGPPSKEGGGVKCSTDKSRGSSSGKMETDHSCPVRNSPPPLRRVSPALQGVSPPPAPQPSWGSTRKRKPSPDQGSEKPSKPEASTLSPHTLTQRRFQRTRLEFHILLCQLFLPD